MHKTLRNKYFKHDLYVGDDAWYTNLIDDLDSVASYIDANSKLYIALTDFLDDLELNVDRYDGHISVSELESLKRFISLICADGVQILPEDLAHLHQHIYTIDSVIEQHIMGKA